MTDDSPAPDSETPPGMPRWAKVFGVFVVVVLLVVALPLAGIADPGNYVRLSGDGIDIGGDHGSEDNGSGDHGGNNTSSSDHGGGNTSSGNDTSSDNRTTTTSGDHHG